MKSKQILNTGISRRAFLVKTVAAGAGLTLGACVAGCAREEPAEPMPEAGPGKAGGGVVSPDTVFEPNAFVRVTPDNRVTVIIKHLEMGQGTYTGLATLVAEELDAAWSQVDVQGAPADANTYNNLFWGKLQGTGGSTAIANSFEQMRKAGAAAREMLVSAAARQWGVTPDQITVQDGVLRAETAGKQASFGELAEAAAQEPVPDEVFLKEPGEFRLIGSRLPRKDSPEKINGTALFTQDVRLPGMLTAVVLHPPRFGARVRSFDAATAIAIKGVDSVVEIPAGVAVLADNFWSAKKGRDALQVEWDETDAFKLGTDEIMAQFRDLADRQGVVDRDDGDIGRAMTEASRTLEATVEFPYLAHATLEPMNCVMAMRDDGVEVWNGEQYQTPDQAAVAEIFGIEPQRVSINMLYAGGSFGRRANPQSDYIRECAHILKAIDGKAPVKLVWAREDDMAAGFYRPMYFHRLRAGLDADEKPVAWEHRIVGQSIATGTAFENALIKDGVDITSVEGAANMPYAVDNIRVELHSPELGVPVQWWRAVGSTHTAFSVETFIDRLAREAEKDPVAFRRDLLANHPRHLGVMELAAEKAGWGEPLPENRGRGIAVHESFNSFVAQVAEVTVQPDNSFTVDRVVIAVDCGIAVNPDIVVAQMEGGMGFGLSAALGSEITLDSGRVVQSNFHDYSVLRMSQMPASVEVHIVPSAEPPTGVGEPATPVIAPAVANALTDATGQVFDRLPLKPA